MISGNFTVVGNGPGGLTIRRGRGTLPEPQRGGAPKGSQILVPSGQATQSGRIPLNPAYRQMLRAQQRQRATPLTDFPPGLTADRAAAEAIARAQLVAMPRRVQLPPYIGMPGSAQSFTFTDATVSSSQITLPAVNAFGIVVSFKVPTGRNGVIDAIANQLTVGGFQDGSGNALWFLTINGMVSRGFNNIKAAVGTMSNPGRYEDKKIRIFENDVVQLLIENISLFAGQGIIQGLLAGYFYPVSEEFESVQ